MKQSLGPVSTPWSSVCHGCSSDGGKDSCWGTTKQCSALPGSKKRESGYFLGKTRGKAVLFIVKMPPLSKEVRELGWQTGSEATQLLLCALLQLLHK